jgi:hypothetical protein
VVLAAKRAVARKEVAASQEALAADAATAQRETKLAASVVERWDAARLDAFAAGHTETVYVTHKSRGRLQTLAAAQAAEAEAATKRATRVKRQEKLRSLLATTARATKALKAQIAAAVAEARAAKVANPKADPEVRRLDALLLSHLNENVYTNLMRGSSASGGGDDSLDLDAIQSFGGGAGGSGGNRASSRRWRLSDSTSTKAAHSTPKSLRQRSEHPSGSRPRTRRRCEPARRRRTAREEARKTRSLGVALRTALRMETKRATRGTTETTKTTMAKAKTKGVEFALALAFFSFVVFSQQRARRTSVCL